MHDPGLVLVDGKTPGLQPLGQPRLDLFGLLPGLTAHREIVGVSHQHRGARHRYTGPWTGFAIAYARGLFQPVEGDVQEQRADHPAWGVPSSVGANPLPFSNTPAFSQARIMSRAGNEPSMERRWWS